MATKGKSIDLDAILEDAVNSQQLNNKADPDVDNSLKIRLVSEDVKPWLAASANVPKDFREKWTKMAKSDTDAEAASKFQPSYAFRLWDGSLPSKTGVNRSLQDMVKKAASSSGIDESKIMKLLTMVNPVTDSEHGKVLQRAFSQQLLADLKDEIRTDPNFDEKRFVELASNITSN
jgi:hypothetical protein